MSFSIERLRGMQDVLPPLGDLWSFVEKVMRETASFYGFSYVRTPVLEFTELFERSAGDSSDVVQKEMYTFNDKSDRSVTMRPEFTAGVLRAVATELSNFPAPIKLMYFGPCYRYEKPQAGRLREFFQFGLEIFGSDSYLADVELISVTDKILKILKIKNFHLEINAVGCSKCRKDYFEKIRSFFKSNADSLCSTCRGRLERNPLRIFDCKNSKCQDLFDDAPKTIDFICNDCCDYFEKLKRSLDSIGISYVVNPMVVRGLDYYTKFVFEFVSDDDNLTICGGGRYDDLSSSLGGKNLPATGLAIGVERLIKLLDYDYSEKSLSENNIIIYLACADEIHSNVVLDLVSKLRELDIKTEYDIVGRSLKSQMRYADKINCKFSAVVGSNEVASNRLVVKNMSDSKEYEFKLDTFTTDFLNYLKTIKF